MTQDNPIVFSLLRYVRSLLPCSIADLLTQFLKFHGKNAWLVQPTMDSLGPREPISDTEGKKCCCKHQGMPSENDLKIVLQTFGMDSCSPGEGSDETRNNSTCNRCLLLDGVSLLLEEKEASMEELEGAFNIFDVNGDGFVDARELQTVLCKLGFEQGMKLEDCEKMINAFDGNGDGKIDLSEFRSMLENAT